MMPPGGWQKAHEMYSLTILETIGYRTCGPTREIVTPRLEAADDTGGDMRPIESCQNSHHPNRRACLSLRWHPPQNRVDPTLGYAKDRQYGFLAYASIIKRDTLSTPGGDANGRDFY